MWVVAVHDCGGSMGEAVDPEHTFSVPNEKAAKSVADAINAAFDANSEYDKIAVHYEVLPLGRYKLPTPSAATLAKMPPPEPGQVAIDFSKVVKRWDEGKELKLLPEPPPPVTEDEEQTAIQSILKGMST